MPLVTLSNSKQFMSPSETTVLEAARTQGFVLEHSCRTGRCGVCKAKVVSGHTQVLKGEEALTDAEKNEGYIFTCCRAAVDDLVLDIEDLGRLGALQKQTLPCKIDSLHLLAPGVMQLFLRLPPKHNFKYVSGQYIDVIAKKNIRRSYSIANAQQVSDKLELHVRHVPEGEMSQYWFHEAQANDLLRLDGPHGTFCVRERDQKNIIFLATGTGIAPIKSMLEDLNIYSDHASSKTIYVYWGGRTPGDFYWQPAFEHLDIHFRPTLSRANEQWQGRRGYVQDAVLADALDVADSVVYACGSDAMIHAARKQLTSQGLAPQNFFSDAFVSSK
jgi:CDP-4-dehydro-6-deoxyglucose reductase, E3